MAAGAFKPYDLAVLAIQKNEINFLSNTVVCVLLDNTYTPNKATHATYADISAKAIVDAGYVPAVVSGKTITIPSGDETLYDCANISFGDPVTLTAKWCVLVVRAGGALAAGDKLIGYADLNTTNGTATASSTAAAFNINTPNGLFGIDNAD